MIGAVASCSSICGYLVRAVPQEIAVALRTGAQMGSKDFEVIAISLTERSGSSGELSQGDGCDRSFSFFLDPSAATLDQLQAIGLPASC